MRELERERAEHALAKLSELADESAEFRQSYRSYVDRFGGAVVMNGLGQALASELAAAEIGAGGDRSDEKKAHRMLADNVAAWLGRAGGVFPGVADAMQAMRAITNSQQPDYLRAQIETLAWLTWHKKFCHAGLPRGGDR